MGVVQAPVVQKGNEASDAAAKGPSTGPAPISLSADASITGRAPAAPAEAKGKLQKKGSFSNLLASLGKKKGSSSSLAETTDPGSSPAQAAKPAAQEKGGLFRRAKSGSKLSPDASPQPALPPAPAAAAEGSPGAMGPLARARAEALGLSTKRSPDGSVDGEVAIDDASSSKDQDRSPAPRQASSSAASAPQEPAAAEASEAQQQQQQQEPGGAPGGILARARSAAQRGLAVAINGGEESRARAAAALAAGGDDDEYAAEDYEEGELAAAARGRRTPAGTGARTPRTPKASELAMPILERLERARDAVAAGLATAVSGSNESRARAGLPPVELEPEPEIVEIEAAEVQPEIAPATSDGKDGFVTSSKGPGAALSSEQSSPGKIPAVPMSAEDLAAIAAEAAAELGGGGAAGAGDGDEYAPADYAEGELEKEAAKVGAAGVLGVLARARSAAAKGLAVAVSGPQAEADAAAAAAAAEADAAAAAAAAAQLPAKEPTVRKFPRGFMWGTATSAYQIEGAYLDEGKGLSIWDAFTHAPGKVADGKTGDIAACHYYRYKEDVALMREMGVKYYRLSMSWARIFPNGKGKANERGVAFYDRLLTELIANKIMPIVTLYHWDLPLSLQMEEDGWLNPKIVDHFVKYAKFCFQRFGDKVKYWITFNEPWSAAVLGHDSGGQHAPARTVDPSREVYKVAHHMLLAHARAYDTYANLFKRKQRGKVGMALSGDWYEAKPAADPEEARRNALAAERALEFTVGWFARPIYQGDYPAVMRERVGDRLPRFTREQREMLKGACDFFGVNHYSSHLCEQPSWYKELGPAKDDRHKLVRVASRLVNTIGRTESAGEIAEGDVPESPGKDKVQRLEDDRRDPVDPYIESTGYWQDVSVDLSDDIAWKTTDMGWGVHPEGIRRVLNYIQNEYNPRGGIIITENGVAVEEEGVEDALKDIERAVYLKRYLTEVHKAIVKDNVDVRGYFVWSLLDNFEWGYGFTKKFGLHHVDFETFQRTPKMSANWFSEVLKKNRLE